MQTAPPRIQWIEKPKENWSYTADGRTLEHQYTIEHVPLSRLRLHETPSRYRVDKMVKEMRTGKPFDLPEADEDGLVLDGHARVISAMRLLGKDASIPVHRHRLVELGINPDSRSASPGPSGS